MIEKILTGKWNFIFAGCICAFIITFSLYLLDSPPGMEDAYTVLSEYCGEVIEDKNIAGMPVLNWQTAFLAGIFIGALIAAAAGGNFKFELFPDDRKDKGFIASMVITPLHGIVTGFLVMFGLLIAGDSFFGQWASALQLSTNAWIFFTALLCAGFFASAVTGSNFEKGGK
jgi:hypothetical protein